jgi:ribosome-associated protein
MDIRKLQKIAVAALEDIKGENIEVINTTKLTSLFDRIIVASGGSNRQVKALARSVQDKVREAGGEVCGVEGEDSGEWVLVDLGDIVVHVMQPTVRAYYNLEELWQAAPKRGKAAAEEKEASAAAAPAPTSTARRRTAATTASAKAGGPAAPRRRTPGKTS